MKQILRKTLLVLLGGVMCSAAWAQDPTPVYFNDFSTATSGENGIEIVGNGVFENDADPRFGRIFHNDPGTTPTKKFRTNYLKLPATLLSSSGASTSKKLTIGFWVNKKNAVDFYNSPIFTTYSVAPTGDGNKSNTWPMMALETRGILLSNNYGIFDSTNSDNVKGTNTLSTAWLDDGNWHYYTCVITETTCIIYYDGNILNSFSVDNSDGHNLAHIFGNLNNLTYVCLGGNQAWDWSGDLDIDPAFGFDDFAVYDAALTAEQIAKIISDKLIQGTSIGKLNYSSGYLEEMSTKMTLKPGTSFNYKFINYYGGANWKNWHLVVFDPDNNKKIVLRADWWDDQNGTTDAEHQRGFSTDPSLNYWDNVPSKMDGAEVDMTITFTSDKKFTMQSRTTKGETSWSYNYRSDYEGTPINLSGFNSIQVALSVNGNYLDLLSSGFSVQMGTNGYATFAYPLPLDLTSLPSGLTAYKATIDGSIVRFTAISQKVASNNGFLLKGTPSQAYTIPVTNSGSIIADNDFMVNASGTKFDGSGYTHYGMIKDSDPLKFGIFDPLNIAIPYNKAYLRVSTSTARELIAVFDDDEITGIGDVRNNITDNKGDFYNLNGQKVLNPTKGLYIVNGKKVIIK